MSTEHFDELTKALATATSRRQAFKTIAAATIGGIGGILGLGGIGTAFAKGGAQTVNAPVSLSAVPRARYAALMLHLATTAAPNMAVLCHD